LTSSVTNFSRRTLLYGRHADCGRKCKISCFLPTLLVGRARNFSCCTSNFLSVPLFVMFVIRETSQTIFLGTSRTHLYTKFHIHSFSYQPYFSRIRSNVILSFTPTSSEWSLTFRFSNQNFVCISQLFREC